MARKSRNITCDFFYVYFDKKISHVCYLCLIINSHLNIAYSLLAGSVLHLDTFQLVLVSNLG
jgi:hypothetical protein